MLTYFPSFSSSSRTHYDNSDKIMKEVPSYKMISQSILIERMKINGSVARKAMRTLEAEGSIKRVVHHHGQWVYSEYRREKATC